MLYIGVDLGTSAVKLLLMDGSGAIQKIVSREYPICFPHPGWSEPKTLRTGCVRPWRHPGTDRPVRPFPDCRNRLRRSDARSGGAG